MSFNQQNKVALVTGSNKGIGFAICQGLLKAGFDVIVTARSLDKAKSAVEKLQSPNAYSLELDISDDGSINRAVEELSQTFDHLDVLINNAGIYPDQGVNILTISRELLNRTMDNNAFSLVRVTQALLPLLSTAPAARIVNVSSGYGQFDGLSASVPSYCLSKLTLNSATIMLAEVLQAQGIVVNAIDPGWVVTEMGGSSAPRSPEQGADTAIWLAAEASGKLTGKLFHDRREISY